MCTSSFHNTTCSTCDHILSYSRHPIHHPCSLFSHGYPCPGTTITTTTSPSPLGYQCPPCLRKAARERREYVDVLKSFVNDDIDVLPPDFGLPFLGELKDQKDPLDVEREARMTDEEKRLRTLEVRSETGGKEVDSCPAATHGYSVAGRKKTREKREDGGLGVLEVTSRPGTAPSELPNYPPGLLKGYVPRVRKPDKHPERDPLMWYPPSDEGSGAEGESPGGGVKGKGKEVVRGGSPLAGFDTLGHSGGSADVEGVFGGGSGGGGQGPRGSVSSSISHLSSLSSMLGRKGSWVPSEPDSRFQIHIAEASGGRRLSKAEETEKIAREEAKKKEQEEEERVKKEEAKRNREVKYMVEPDTPERVIEEMKRMGLIREVIDY